MTATIKSLSHESNASVYYDTGNKTKKQVDISGSKCSRRDINMYVMNAAIKISIYETTTGGYRKRQEA